MAVLWDGSVVVVGNTEGDYIGESAGANDFVVIKLTAAGEIDWSWQVTSVNRVAYQTLGLCFSTDLCSRTIALYYVFHYIT